MKALPISETEKGVAYTCGKSSFFYPLNCAFYCNWLHTKNLPIITFEVFKEKYFKQIHTNLYTSSKDKHTYL